MYIVPRNFKGKVVVVYGYKGGVPARFNGKRYVFEIPASGILLTSSQNAKEHSKERDFYGRLSNGNLEQMMHIPSGGDPGIQTQLINISHGRPIVLNVVNDKFSYKGSDSLNTLTYTVK